MPIKFSKKLIALKRETDESRTIEDFNTFLSPNDKSKKKNLVMIQNSSFQQRRDLSHGDMFPMETLFVVSVWWGGEENANGMFEYNAQDRSPQN